jgi:2-keto-4-pentenoate hydratase/2-oxohepta-3-ene-1,7-dioic acid hydratase in catechol pathway
MRICRFVDTREEGAGAGIGAGGAGRGARVGYLDGEVILPVAGGDGPAGLETVLDLAMAANADPGLRPRPDGDPVPLASARLLAPVAEPPSIRDFYAFEQHVRTARARRGREMHPDWYELPVFYFTNPASVLGPGDPVAAPPRSAELDYELEVACVLGRGGTSLRLEDADEVVAGFTVMNDWSARDVQRREMAQSLGPAKGKDFATSLGPALVTAAEFAPGGLREVPSAVMTVGHLRDRLHPGAVAGPRGRQVPVPGARRRGRAGGGRPGRARQPGGGRRRPRLLARPHPHPPPPGPVGRPDVAGRTREGVPTRYERPCL